MSHPHCRIEVYLYGQRVAYPSGIFASMSDTLNIDQPTNDLIRAHHQDCTISQQIGSGSVEYTGCKDVYVFMSGTVVVFGATSDKVLHPTAGPIEITRTGNDRAADIDFDENEEI